jgi:tetratricopeptide (TPR) repeat protein
VIPEAFPPASSIQASARPVEEQLQEVDFYIRLGFHTEALTKLNEIAKISPGNPELASRYEKIGEIAPPAAEQKAPSSGAADASLLREAADSFAPDSLEAFRELDADGALDSFINSAEENAAGPASTPAAPATGFVIEPPPPQTALQAKALQPEFQGNHLFADLMEEVGAISEREIAKESFEDHFSLGTAYRDMELNEEAIKEFELALKIADVKQDARRIVQCCGMLSACFLKKGMPTSAVRWCQTGLSVADISSHEAIALRYDMGVAHSMSGSHERALECFDQIFGFDPGYRDVAQKIDELKGGFQRHAP